MSSSGRHQGDGENGNKQSVIKIDPDGDLTLVVGKTKTPFLVCSKTLSRSALFWKRCLYGQFKEAKPAAGQDWIVELPEDNPSGLKCLLLLVHGFGHKMPEIDLQLAFKITVLTNKYNMTQYLWAVAKSWLQDLEPPRPDEGGDGTIIPQLRWLWVTKELGDSGQYGQTFAGLTQMISTTADGHDDLILRPYEHDHADTLTTETLGEYDAEKDILFLLADEVKAAREIALSDIQDVLKMDIKRLRDAVRDFDSSKGSGDAVICKSWLANSRRHCEYAMHGIVTKMSSGKNSAVRPIPKIHLSVEEFLPKAVFFKSRIEEEIRFVADYQHCDCTPFRSKLPSISTVKAKTLQRWGTPGTINAFKKQAQLSGLEKAGEDADSQNRGDTGLSSAARKRSRDELEAPTSATIGCRIRLNIIRVIDSDSGS